MKDLTTDLDLELCHLHVSSEMNAKLKSKECYQLATITPKEVTLSSLKERVLALVQGESFQKEQDNIFLDDCSESVSTLIKDKAVTLRQSYYSLDSNGKAIITLGLNSILDLGFRQGQNVETDIGAMEAAEEQPGDAKCKVLLESKAMVDRFLLDGRLVDSADSLQMCGLEAHFVNLTLKALGVYIGTQFYTGCVGTQ
ncbi:unnamed protein product [Mucor hiemalis]